MGYAAMPLEIHQRMSSLMGRLASTKLTPEERADIKTQLSKLSAAEARLLSDIGSHADILEDEATFAEQAQIEGGYSE